MIEVHVHLCSFMRKDIRTVKYKMNIEEYNFFIHNLKYGTQIEIDGSLCTYNKNNPSVMRINYGEGNKPIFFYEITLDIVESLKRL